MVGAELLRRVERDIMLQIVDAQWKDHLYSLDHLKEGIGLRGYGQRDPLVETVIVDEVHAVAGTKRGAHLALSLERLDELLERPAQRIGLSATVRPIDEVARFLGGSRPVEVVAPRRRRSGT